MGGFIVKHPDGRYFFWSTITDSPTSYAMTRDELTAHVREEEGQRGVEELQARLARADEKGTSSTLDNDADDVMWLNRAGEGETALTRAQILDYVGTPGSKPPRGFEDDLELPDGDPRRWSFARYLGAI